jgi:hypothetical protein
MFFIDDVSSVFLSAKLAKRQPQIEGIGDRGILVYGWFVVDPRMAFSGVEVAHEGGGEFAHDAMVPPAFVPQAEGKCDEPGEKVILMDSSVDEDGAVDCAVVCC